MTRIIKDSGIDWIGAIPKNWEITKLKNILIEKKEKNDSDDPIVLSLARSGIKVRDISNNEGQLAESYLNYNKVSYGDLLLNPMDLVSGANCNISEVEGVISPAYFNLNPINRNNIYYYGYYFKLQYWHMVLFAHGKGVSFENRWTLNRESLLNYVLPVPPSYKQKAIAHFLDEKVLEIDNIISKTKKAIEEYKKYKQSLITETVTNGLDGNVPMKDSGIEWIGEIPKHWDLNKLKYFYNIVSGTTPTSKDENWNGEILWVTPADYNTEDILIKDSKRKITKLGVKNSSLSIIPINSIIVSNRAPIGKIALNKKEVTTNQGCKALVLKKTMNNKFVYYTLSIYSDVLNMLGRGTTFLELSGRELSNFIISIPPIKEQEQIAIYLDKKTNQIDQIISTKQNLLIEMEAYKKSLIYETVTGKREVE